MSLVGDFPLSGNYTAPVKDYYVGDPPPGLPWVQPTITPNITVTTDRTFTNPPKQEGLAALLETILENERKCCPGDRYGRPTKEEQEQWERAKERSDWAFKKLKEQYGE